MQAEFNQLTVYDNAENENQCRTFTGTGKIKRKHAYHSHILTKKTTKQKRNLCYSGIVSAADEAKIKNLLVK